MEKMFQTTNQHFSWLATHKGTSRDWRRTACSSGCWSPTPKQRKKIGTSTIPASNTIYWTGTKNHRNKGTVHIHKCHVDGLWFLIYPPLHRVPCRRKLLKKLWTLWTPVDRKGATKPYREMNAQLNMPLWPILIFTEESQLQSVKNHFQTLDVILLRGKAQLLSLRSHICVAHVCQI